MNIFSSFFKKKISDKEYDDFINLGKISDKIVESIAVKIMTKVSLDDREKAVFYSKTAEISKYISEVCSKTKNT